MTIATMGRFMKKLAKPIQAFQSTTGLYMKRIEVWQPQPTEAPRQKK
jgi:hypothetical protein